MENSVFFSLIFMYLNLIADDFPTGKIWFTKNWYEPPNYLNDIRQISYNNIMAKIIVHVIVVEWNAKWLLLVTAWPDRVHNGPQQ